MFTLTFSGNITADAEHKIYNENSVINFTVAVNHSIKKGDEWVDETDFIQISRWSKGTGTPKVLEHLKKGKKVIITTDRVKINSYENKEQQIISQLTCNANELELC